MTETFTRKKVESLTLGEKLARLRTDTRLSLPEVSKAIKVQVKYLEFLERGQYERLPADVYVRGYLRSYARYLNLDENAMLRLYEQERNINQAIHPEDSRTEKRFSMPKTTFAFSSRAVAMGGIALVLLGVFGYLWFQFRQFTTDPLLALSEPNPNTIVEGKSVWLKGKTDRGTQITINNQATFVTPDGTFVEEITLQNGVNQIIVKAVNRFNKEKTETLQVEARYDEAPAVSSQDLALKQAEADGLFRIALSIKEVPTKVTLLADGVVVFDGVLSVGDPKVFEAKQKFTISTPNGGEVLLQRTPGATPEPLAAQKTAVKDKVLERETAPVATAAPETKPAQ